MNIYTRQAALVNDVKTRLGTEPPTPELGDTIRFPAPGKDSRNKACYLITNSDCTWACHGNWITGESFYWFSHGSATRHINARTEPKMPSAIKPTAAQQLTAYRVSKEMLSFKSGSESNNYTTQKGLDPSTLLFDGDDIIVTLTDVAGKPWSYQRISPDGSKRFLKDGRIAGTFALLGQLPTEGVVYIAEGFATANTVHQLTGRPTAAAMNAGNMLQVGWEILQAYPDVKLVFVADNDHKQHRNDKGANSNTGIFKASEAACLLSASWIAPPLPCEKAELCSCSDFNDYHFCQSQTPETQA